MPEQLTFTLCQRWNHRKARYRPAGEVIDPSLYGVEPIDSDTAAAAFVEEHHYSASYPVARYRVGLYRTIPFARPELVGVAVFSNPMQQACIPCWTGLPAAQGTELGRLVLRDDVPAMGESWFMARAFSLLRRAKPQLQAVIAYCDPLPRLDATGHQTKPGHIGTVYAALNATYRGRARPRTLLLAPNGTVLSERSLSKLKADDKGRDYAERGLRGLGAPARRRGESGSAYLARALATLSLRPWRTKGNHVFVWALGPDPRSLRARWRALPRPLVPDRIAA